MIISQVTQRVFNAIRVAESHTLTNQEEQTLTLELCHYLKQLLRLITSRQDYVGYKRKARFIRSTDTLTHLLDQIYHSQGPRQYIWGLGIVTNWLYFFRPEHPSTHHRLLRQLLAIFESSYPIHPSLDMAQLEYPLTVTLSSVQDIEAIIRENGYQHILIPMHVLHQDGVIESHLIESLQGLPLASIIFNIQTKADWLAFHQLTKIIPPTSNLKLGISVDILHKNALFWVYDWLQSVPALARKHAIIHVQKDHQLDIPSPKKGVVAVNTFYKWAVYTLCTWCRTDGFSLIVHTNNLVDISWILLIRAQKHIERNLKFESNISKFPSIAKVLAMLDDVSFRSKSVLMTPKTVKENIHLLLTTLIQQSRSYLRYKHSDFSLNQIFIKSHQRFYRYLKHNTIKIYLDLHRNTSL